MSLLGVIIILIVNIFVTVNSDSPWIQKAFDKHKKVLENMGDFANSAKETIQKIPDLNRQHPLQDLFGNLDPNKDAKNAEEFNPPQRRKDIPPPRHTLDPLNIINDEDYGNNQFDNPLEMHDYETQHSFQHPVDMISQNWILVGDAVATTNFARLTPEDGGRRGVVWNKFGLHLEEWQITLEINIHTRNKMGGDGFAVWLLDENDIKRAQMGDRKRYNDDSYELLLGDFYGIRRDFNGTGIIFDTFDNDNNGDNPLIFSVVNDGKPRAWNVNTDLDKEREKIKQEVEDAMFSPMAKDLFPTQCTLDYHGRESVKILIRYQNQQLHVYTDKEHKKVEGTDADKLNMLRRHALPFAFGRHFGMAQMLSKMGVIPQQGEADIPHLCLVRKIDLNVWKNPHIAISAITGQLADNHDILKLETKFLRKEHQIQDADLPKTGYQKRNTGMLVQIYWFVICTLSVGLICETISEIMIIRNIYKGNRHIVSTINKLNPFIQLSYYLNVAQYILLVFAFNWKCILCNSPLLLIRAQKFMTNNVLLSPQKFEQKGFLYGTTYRQWLWIQLTLLCLSGFYHFWRFLHI